MNVINIEALGKRFGDKVIFSDITVTLPDRGVVRLLGDSGSGKTTLLRIIAGLDPEYSGKITHDGKVSFAFQEYRLFNSLTAKENVLAVKNRASSEDAENAAEILRRLRFGDADMDKYPSDLSGGMKQRVSVARALFAGRDIILLDEPTKELDEELREILLGMISEASQSALVILVSHIDDALPIPCAAEINLNNYNSTAK